MARQAYTPGMIIAWSPSRVNQFVKCPRMFHEESNLRTVPFVQTDEQKEGDRVHKALDARIKRTLPLLTQDAHLEPLVQSFERAPGELFAEQKMTLNAQFKPTGWFDKDAWIRLTIDVMKINGTSAFIGDWKTGKRKVDEYQLKLYAAVTFIFYPSIETITTAYIWLKTKQTDKEVYHRSQFNEMWQGLLREPTRMQDYSNRNFWPETPGGHCGWCGVNKQGRCQKRAITYRGA